MPNSVTVDEIIANALARENLYQNLILTPEELKEIQNSSFTSNKLKKTSKLKYSIIEGEDGKTFAMLATLAKGAQGTVKVVQSIDDGKFYLAKVIKVLDEKSDDYKIKEARQERVMLERKQHLVSFTERKTAKYLKKMYTIMKICPGQCLEPMEDSHLPHDLSDKEQFNLLLNILNKLDEIQKENIIHRDLHGGNVLVDRKSMEVNIIDWGLALDSDENGYCMAKAVSDTQGVRPDVQFANGIDVLRISDYLLLYIKNDTLKLIVDEMAACSFFRDSHNKMAYNVVDIGRFIEKVQIAKNDIKQAQTRPPIK